jgi:hypothetical protein
MTPVLDVLIPSFVREAAKVLDTDGLHRLGLVLAGLHGSRLLCYSTMPLMIIHSADAKAWCYNTTPLTHM